MSWLAVPSIVHKVGDDEAGSEETIAYLKGVGNDSGLVCYYDSEEDEYIVSDGFFPTMRINGMDLKRASYTYGGRPVWAGSGLFVFYSISEGKYIYKTTGGLAEPVYADDLDSETGASISVAQDMFWNVPPFDGYNEREEFTPGHDGVPASIYGMLVKTVYRKESEGMGVTSFPSFCGIYKHAGDYVTVGDARFEVTSGPDELLDEWFVLSPKKDNSGHYVYRGASHSIRYFPSRGAYCIGVPSTIVGNVWWELNGMPPLATGGSDGKSASFSPKTYDENGNVVKARGVSSCRIEYSGRVAGPYRTKILVGDISLWR